MPLSNSINLTLLGISLSLFLGLSTAGAYQEASVTDGGTITGKITLRGGKPVPRGFNLVTFPDPVYCGRISNGKGFRLLQEFTVGEYFGVKDVVVALEGVERGKPFPFEESRVEALDCQFKPFVTVVRDVRNVEIVNMDPVMHDIQAYQTSELGPRVLWNVPLPMNAHHPSTAGMDAQYHKHLAGTPVVETVHMTKGRRVFVMQCGFHAFMESWGFVVDNPYYALTDGEGKFEIKDVPPGKYKLVIWHPQSRHIIEQQVTIAAKETVTANVELVPREGARAGMEAVENPRFGLGMLGDREIKPTLELQKP